MIYRQLDQLHPTRSEARLDDLLMESLLSGTLVETLNWALVGIIIKHTAHHRDKIQQNNTGKWIYPMKIGGIGENGALEIILG